MHRRACLGVAAATCLFLCGCGGPAKTYKYRIAVIPKGLTHEFWQSIHRGAQRAADDLTAQGIATEVLWDGPSKESDALDQINIIRQKTGMGIQGLVLAPQHSEQMVAPVQETVQKGIPVVIIDSGLDKEALQKDPNLIVKYIATDNYNGGKLAAQHLLQVLAEQGKAAPKLVLFRYAVGSESTEQREQGFLDHINQEIDKQKQAGQPTIQLVSSDKYAGPTVETAEKQAGPLLNQLGDKGIDGIFAVNESATSGMLNALRSIGLNQKVRLMGFDSSEPLLQAVKEGDVDGLIVQDPYRMSYLGVWTLVQYLEGYDVAKDGKVQSTGEYVLTAKNIDAVQTRERFDKELQKKRKIETPTYPKKAQ
jgi:ribose transport system substrate-binding protein